MHALPRATTTTPCTLWYLVVRPFQTSFFCFFDLQGRKRRGKKKRTKREEKKVHQKKKNPAVSSRKLVPAGMYALQVSVHARRREVAFTTCAKPHYLWRPEGCTSCSPPGTRAPLLPPAASEAPRSSPTPGPSPPEKQNKEGR